MRAEEAGSAYLYTLNRDHLAAPAIEVLARIRSELERRLRSLIASWSVAPVNVSMFGSAARGDGDTRSDIDILVVRPRGVAAGDPRWSAQLQELSDQVYGWTGNRVGLSEVSQEDVRRLRREPVIVDELRRDAITIAGPSTRELLGGDT